MILSVNFFRFHNICHELNFLYYTGMSNGSLIRGISSEEDPGDEDNSLEDVSVGEGNSPKYVANKQVFVFKMQGQLSI